MLDDQEKWQSTFPGRIGVKHRGPDGVRDELVRPGREFTISTADRRAHQNAVANRIYDPFTNGSFVPVDLPEAVQDELGVQPNHVTEDDLIAVAVGVESEALAVLRKLNTPAVLERVYAYAANEGAGQQRLDLIRVQLEASDPSRKFTFGRTAKPISVYRPAEGRIPGEIDGAPKAPQYEVNGLGEPVGNW